MQVGLIDMLYCKSLRVSSSAKAGLGVGSIVNLPVQRRLQAVEPAPVPAHALERALPGIT